MPDVVASGAVRADLSVKDVELLAGMLGAALRGESAEVRSQLTHRALLLIKTGIQLAS